MPLALCKPVIMNRYKKVLLSLSLFLFFAPVLHAQRYLGIAVGDWCGVNSVYLNPATIADNHEKLSISLLSFNFGIDNNLGKFSKLGAATGTATGGSSNIFTADGWKDFSMILPHVGMRGPGVMVALTRKISLSLTTGFRVMNQIDHFDKTLFGMISNTASITDKNYNVTSENFNWTAHMWGEIGLTLGAVVLEREKGEMKLGITFKRLAGIGYVAIKGNNLDISYKAGADTFFATHSDVQFASNIVNDSTAIFSGVTASDLFGNLFGHPQGKGTGVDIGFTYKIKIGEEEPSDFNESKSTHNVTIGGSIIDVGAIRYAGENNATIQVGGSGYLSGYGITNHKSNTDSFLAYAYRQGFAAF